jgi:HEAT repeat protein
VLKKLRETKGSIHTQALLASVNRLDGERRQWAREALAERLTRMTAETLRGMAKDEEPEMRRAAVLAMAMKDEKVHIPDLIAALLDEEEVVVRGAKAGLKSLAGQDFGPGVNATAGEKKLAFAAWNEWLGKQKN